MKIAMFGAGYVGLVTSACFAALGHEVVCCDVDVKKIRRLKKGIIPIYEPGLDELISRNLKEKRLSFTNFPVKAINFGDFIFIGVGTPDNNGEVDLRYVEAVAREIGQHMNCAKIVVNKSTVPVGTGKRVSEIIREEMRKRNSSFVLGIASNPEFLREGTAIDDFMRPDRIVIGSDENWVLDRLSELYVPLTKNGHSIFKVDLASSEMSKYASNAFLATKISFINEVSAICEATGADVENVRQIMSADKRIGGQFLYPGIGYGGSCFPKDVVGLIAMAKKNGVHAKITASANETNHGQCGRFIKKIFSEMMERPSGSFKGRVFAVWGLSFKPNTDDMREAPSINVVLSLLRAGAKVRVYDPVAMEESKKFFDKDVHYAENMYDCLLGAEALIVVTEWPQFKAPDFTKMKKLLKKPVVFDGRNIYSPQKMKELGFIYVSIGRAKVTP